MLMPTPTLSVKEKVGYGLGDTASHFVWDMVGFWILIFYTDTFGIPAAAAGTIMLIARIWDMVNDPLMGIIADRTSTRCIASNQLRLWFSTFAYFLISRLRGLALQGTRLARATAGSIRVHLMKIAAQVTISVRRVYVRLASGCPTADIFAIVHQRLLALKNSQMDSG